MKLLLAFTVLLLVSCSKHSDGTSVWAGGLFILPILTLAGAAFFYWKAYKASKSNSTTQHGTTIEDNTGNVPIHKTGWFIFSMGLLIATIAIIWMVNSDK